MSLEKKSFLSLREMTEIALFAALTAVLAQLAIPLPNGVPLTLQTFAVALVGYTLGGRKGLFAIAVYLLLGAVGLPVFANFKGGAMVLFGVTGGFLWGFLFLAVCTGYSRDRTLGPRLLWSLLGLFAAHVCGVLQFAVVTGTPPVAAAFAVSLPFIPKDAITILAAMALSSRLRSLRPFQGR